MNKPKKLIQVNGKMVLKTTLFHDINHNKKVGRQTFNAKTNKFPNKDWTLAELYKIANTINVPSEYLKGINCRKRMSQSYENETTFWFNSVTIFPVTSTTQEAA